MKRKKFKIILAGAIAFALTFLFTLRSAPAQDRFDHKVRNDFFAGFAGDREALDRAMKHSESILRDNPKHAEALVWHGGGLYAAGGQAFQQGDSAKGQELVMKGLAEMDQAVALEPVNIGVRVPRGAILLQSTLNMPDSPFRQPLIEKGLADYEKTLDLQKSTMDQLGTHPRGELLFGIADAHRRLGNEAKAKAMFERISEEMKGTNYARRADVWLTTGTLQPAQARCVGCHTAK